MKFSDSILAKLFGLRTEDGMEDETQEKSDINVQQAMDAERKKRNRRRRLR